MRETYVQEWMSLSWNEKIPSNVLPRQSQLCSAEKLHLIKTLSSSCCFYDCSEFEIINYMKTNKKNKKILSYLYFIANSEYRSVHRDENFQWTHLKRIRIKQKSLHFFNNRINLSSFFFFLLIPLNNLLIASNM